MATTPRIPATATKGRSDGNQLDVLARSVQLHHTVAARPAARPMRPAHVSRRCHRPNVAMPTSAPSGGASATA